MGLEPLNPAIGPLLAPLLSARTLDSALMPILLLFRELGVSRWVDPESDVSAAERRPPM